jgi:transcriptional regulator with XRE-family HTH domain
METLLYLGKVLKEKRLKNKKLGKIYRTIDVGNALGISRQLVIHYESGKRKIQFDLFWRWCDVLGITHRTVVERLEKELKGVKNKDAQN